MIGIAGDSKQFKASAFTVQETPRTHATTIPVMSNDYSAW